MVEVAFFVMGRRTTAGSEPNQELAAKLRFVEANFQKRLDGVVDSKTGEAPRVTVNWNTPSQMAYEIIGSKEVIREAEKRMNQGPGKTE